MDHAPYILVLMQLALASLCDLKTREVPDWIPLSVVIVAVTAGTFHLGGIQPWMIVTGGALGLLIGLVLFRWAQFGGADAKLVAAVGCLLGPIGLFFLLFWMAVLGGVLALIAVARGHTSYAYVPAITGGFLAYLVWPVQYYRHF